MTVISLSVDPPEWFRDGQLDRAGPDVPLSRPIAAATVGSVRAAGAVLGAADRVGVCAHHWLHERGQHRLEQVRVGLLQLLQTAGRSLVWVQRSP